MKQYRTYSEGQYSYLKNTSDNLRVRSGQRGHQFVEDEELTVLGFAGVENTDWANVRTHTGVVPEGLKVREGVRDEDYVVDIELTATGFAGTENVDWQNVFSSWKSYWTQRSLFFLDGTIITVGENKYFKDRSSAARNFLITGYDFDSTWQKGFPYKSAATISAPAGDATLIAADINNFLYAGDGTPNQIPVVSLFQNIDYANTIYCKHVAQVVDGNGVETSEPYVSEIFMTKAALSASDLTKATTYFGVPAEVTSNVKWISPAGNDTTGNGSKANPWKTITKATKDGTAGDTVYVKTGTYIEDNVGNGTGGMWVTKGGSVICTGLVNIKGYRADYAILVIENITWSIKGAIIGNADVSTTATVWLHATKTPSATLDRCLIKNGYRGVNAQTAPTLAVTNCVFTGITGIIVNSGDTDLTMTGNFSTTTGLTTYSQVSTAVKTIIVKYNKFYDIVVTNGFSSDINISYNKTSDRITINGNADVTAATSKLKISYNVLSLTATNNQIYVAHNYFDCEISNNTLTSLAATTGSIIHVTEQTTLVVKNNKILNASNGNMSQIICESTTALAKNYTIDGNILYTNANNTPIQIGDESTALGYNTVSGTIKNNAVYGAGDASLAHGIVVFNQSGVSMKYNYIEGVSLGYVMKNAGLDCSSSPIMYNIANACGTGIVIKGAKKQKVYNNLIYKCTNVGLSAIFNPAPTSKGSTEVDFKNNIIYEDGAASSFYLCSISGDDVAEPTTMTTGGNIYYSVNNPNFNKTLAGVLNLTAWKALGFDADVLTSDPLLTNFVPQAGSPAIGVGVDLGAANDDGLDDSTTWGSSSAVPVVVTKQQGASWDIGAYVH